ncbi:tetratricopeptide repeat protein [Tetragenococcus halophilus]|uniref:tetratricopeptide repeat protein n=1 Tax=Tetragenococcus halophilus TaxID=51669 RepID=UPI00209BB12D|nr:tetratricopeptide repeat protein [Tetragenococcus halophilus]MCO8290909.1 tetratricopeptide repeat protein [Tetragenococcus halophilus]MCT8310011.1 tetratricopeptide repeat protein [Tetragenococcus halophilus]
MFDFFNKKKKKTNDVKENTLSEEQLSNINQAIDTKKSEITKGEKTATKAEQAKLYEELGLLYAQKNDDEAIPILEKSLERKLSMGDGYKKLMSLYNEKRKEAARNGDDAGIDKYMNKMDEMRSVAKKLTISGDK